MAESPAETARIQMQSDRARGVSLHRSCPALCLPGYRGYPVPLVPKGDLGFYRARYEQAISLNRTATGQARGLV